MAICDKTFLNLEGSQFSIENVFGKCVWTKFIWGKADNRFQKSFGLHFCKFKIESHFRSAKTIVGKGWLMWLLELRKLRSSKKVEILQDVLILQVASWYSFFFYEEKKWDMFFPIFTITFSISLSYLVVHSTLNFAKTVLYFFNHKHKPNIKGARSEFYKKKSLILGAAMEKCSGIKLPGLQLNKKWAPLTSVFEDFGHIFSTCYKKFNKILKAGKILRCVTSLWILFCKWKKLLP